MMRAKPNKAVKSKPLEVRKRLTPNTLATTPNTNTTARLVSTNKIMQAALVMANRFILPDSVKHLDIGSGHGDLIELFRSRINVTSDACDYTDELMQLNGVKVSVVDLNIDKLESQGISVRVEEASNRKSYPHIYGAIRCELVDRVSEAHMNAEGHLVQG